MDATFTDLTMESRKFLDCHATLAMTTISGIKLLIGIGISKFIRRVCLHAQGMNLGVHNVINCGINQLMTFDGV